MTSDRDRTSPLDRLGKAVLYQETNGTQHEIELPLTSRVDISAIVKELRLPLYVDTEYFPMQTALVAIWASERAKELSTLYPEAFGESRIKTSIDVLLLGGASVKMHCQHSNGNGPLSRTINDVDFIVPKKQGADFCRLLLNMHKAFGTQFKFFITRGDRTFNALNEGQRYRIRTINGLTETGVPKIGRSDIFCDCICLRHRIDVRDSFKKARANLHTIGLENMVLSKSQFITDLPRTDLDLLQKQGQMFRVLSYKYYRRDRIIVGMEEKDAKDMCALFLDHQIGEEEDQINAWRIRRVLEKDKKLALTVRLNLSNLAVRVDKLREWLNGADLSTVLTRLNDMLMYLPKIEKEWHSPWWNADVETPSIE